MLKSIGVIGRIGIAVFGVNFFIIGMGYLFLGKLIEEQMIQFQAQPLFEKKIGKINLLSEKEILKLGIEQGAWNDFISDFSIRSKGFIVKVPSTQIHYVTKQKSGSYFVKSREAGFIWWLSLDSLKLFLFMFSVTFMGSFLIFLLAKQSLEPIRKARQIGENLLAGRYEFDFKYTASDDLSQLMIVMGRIGKELEHREKRLSDNNERVKDSLTGLMNSKSFNETLVNQLRLAQRQGNSLGLLKISLDNFSRFIDNFGYFQGDEMVKAASQGLKKVARGSDMVSRTGGKEFSIILPQIENSKLFEIAEKFRNAIENEKTPYLVNPEKKLSVTASVGGTYVDGSTLDLSNLEKSGQDIVNQCDQNLDKAKEKGRNVTIV
jgi:diguanylate cyclase (GGDEF)-like protein